MVLQHKLNKYVMVIDGYNKNCFKNHLTNFQKVQEKGVVKILRDHLKGLGCCYCSSVNSRVTLL